ncbi:MAG: hypothetical protein DMG65_19425 [Candidatus Angelobacter sp. Gp1-AA117]|nr:MAG: hypothetical protein DMG65_19425 [Candidatus Angelobacter sp. Gp1-AA117]
MKIILRLFISLVAFSTIGLAQTMSVSSPAPDATVGSPVQFTATANGGSRPVTAIKIYVDGQSMYTFNNTNFSTNSTSINTSIALAGGAHTAIVKAWNAAGTVFSNTLNVTVGSSTPAPTPSASGITVSSPANGATVGSPVNFVASATPPSGSTISAMRIYVDGASAYTVNASSLNTALALATGGHNVNVQAWDNTGAVYKNTLTINVGSSTTPTPTPTTSSRYTNDLTATAKWMATTVAPDGALLYGTQAINPYYSNLAAIGLTKNASSYGMVQGWMQWYINHLNWPDKWGLYGTTYDYDYNNGAEVSHIDADSTDSYAATFLSLSWAYFNTGDANAQSYVRTLSYQLDAIGQVLVQTQQPDGLTWAKPDYQIKYLMDNCEAYRGLRDLALVFQNAFNDSAKAQFYNAKADLMLQGINGMYLGGGKWAVYKDGIGRLIAPIMTTWYADASAQMFPVMQGVIPPTDARAVATYNTFVAAWPGWQNLSFSSQDPFPWVMIAGAAAVMGDNARVNTYITNIENMYVNQGFPWTFYNMEGGWFMRLNAYMNGKRPL